LKAMRPFLLHYVTDAQENEPSPPSFYDESLCASMLVNENEPLARSAYAISTQTKTKARGESDDED
jgi:hypothetical protein